MAYIDTWEFRVVETLMCREPYISMEFGQAWKMAVENARFGIWNRLREEAYEAEEYRLATEGEAV